MDWKELERISRVVGRDGKITQRAAPPAADGSWVSLIESVNTLIDDMAQPTTEMARVIGAQLSEHGKGNAIDVRSFKLVNGTAMELTDPHVAKDLRERLRKSTCTRFHTVLGPGSDGYHENHVHVDLAERRGGYRMCQWEVREPGEEPTAAVPLPVPRPASASHDEKNDQR